MKTGSSPFFLVLTVSLQRCPLSPLLGCTSLTCCFLHGHPKHFDLLPGSVASMLPPLNLLLPQHPPTPFKWHPHAMLRNPAHSYPPPPFLTQVKTSPSHQVRDRWVLLPHTSQLRKEMQMRASVAIQGAQVTVAAAANERLSDNSLVFTQWISLCSPYFFVSFLIFPSTLWCSGKLHSDMNMFVRFQWCSQCW